MPPPDAPRGTLQWRYSGEPALTRDAGCRSASLVWTRAQLHYLTKRQQQNVDNETTYKTLAMKQPKRSGLAWSHGRDAALLRAVSSRSSTTGLAWSHGRDAALLRAVSSRSSTTPTNHATNPITTGTMPASTTLPQRSLNCGLRALAPSPTSSLSTGLLAHSFRALVALASTSTFVSKGPAHPPLSGRDGEWASPSLLWYSVLPE